MSNPGYVSIAGDFARKIRSGELPPDTQLPSSPEIQTQYSTSDITVRRAIRLLQSQGLVYTIRRRGVFVAKRPTLTRVSPERQMESAETTFQNETQMEMAIERESAEITAPTELVRAFGLAEGDKLIRTVTRAKEGSRPISISDTYQPIGVEGIGGAAYLEETIGDRVPSTEHAEWLRTGPGDLVKTVHQRFIAKGDKLIMLSDVSYPLDRYDAFVFRMTLDQGSD